MNITSIHFALFSLAAVVLYYMLPRRKQNYWLLILSYIFCITWAWQFALVLLLVTLINFFLAQQVFVEGKGRRNWLWIGISLNVLTLILFRISSFFLPQAFRFLAQLGISTTADGLQILIPLGLSYYILENISYLVDVYRGQLKASKDFVDFALYLAYFPKLIAGPIERAINFLPKLSEKRLVDNQLMARSLTLIVIGIVRKLFVADVLSASILTDVFKFPARYTPPELLGWLIIYAFSIYNDFAGYTNIVRGVSGLFGIELSPNFQQPYFARNFTEFWNRWHISLSHWLRDYIYFPLSRMFLRRNRSRRNLPNFIIPPLVTMIISGLWHGFSGHMLLWGGLHGLYQIIERVPTFWRPIIPPQRQPRWRQALAATVIFSLVIFAWVPFRWELSEAFEFWKGLVNWSSFAMRYRRMFLVAPLIISVVGLDWIQYHYRDEFIFLRWPRLAQAFCLAVVLLFVFIVTGGEGVGAPFVYQGF